MVNVATRLNYFAENETAKTATRNFDLILEKASEQYKKIWNKYLDLVKKYEAVTANHETIAEIQKEKIIYEFTQTSPKNFLTSQDDRLAKSERKEKKMNETNENVMEHILKKCSLDFGLDVEATALGNDPSFKGSVLFGRDFSHVPKSSTLINNDIKSSIHIADNAEDVKKEATNDNMEMSFDIVCNSPAGESTRDKSEKSHIHKIAVANISKQNNHQAKKSDKCKEPLQAIENVSLALDVISNSNNGRKAKRKGKQSPIKTLRQTKILFRTPKMNTDDSVCMIPSSQTIQSTMYEDGFSNCTKLMRNNTNISKLSEKQSTKDLTIPSTDSGCIQGNVTFEDVIQRSPEQRSESRIKNRLKLKRRLLRTGKTNASIEKSPKKKVEELDSAFMSTPLISVEEKTPLRSGIKENINCSSSTTSVVPGMSPFFISETINEDEMGDQECPPRNEMLNVKEFIENDEKAACTKQIFPKTNISQSTYEDETYFPVEESFVRANSMGYLLKQSRKEQLEKVAMKLTSHKTDLSLSPPLKKRVPEMGGDVPTSDGSKSKSKPAKLNEEKAWSCWECEEYYKTKRGVSEEQMRIWKNQCSRHRNPYYAMKETPPGFWDPVIPDSCPSTFE